MKRYFVLLIVSCVILSISLAKEDSVNTAAEKYVKLVLALGRHDADCVDAYYGPAEWQQEVQTKKISLSEIISQAKELSAMISSIPVAKEDEMGMLRKIYLTKQLGAVIAKAEMLGGAKYAFDEESQKLFDVVAPVFSENHFKTLLQELDSALPKGNGTLQERYEAFHNHFIIPKEKLDTVFKAAIAECRKRTAHHIALAYNENFVVEYVTNKAWSGYNWYKGNNYSIIQVNVDLPIFIDRAIDLAAHEGYPGHHVYNALLESELMRKRGWIEFCIYPLFSPQSLIAEGSANYGIQVVLPGKERVNFEKGHLFPLAGFDSSKAEQYYAIQDLVAKLAYAGNEAARNYLNGKIPKEQAVAWLTTYALMAKPRAEQRVAFFEKYRSYVINYNYGQDLVRQYVETHGGTSENPEMRWKIFEELLSSPRLPSELK